MPDFCAFGQELLLWKGFCYGNMSVKVYARCQIMPFVVAI